MNNLPYWKAVSDLSLFGDTIDLQRMITHKCLQHRFAEPDSPSLDPTAGPCDPQTQKPGAGRRPKTLPH